MAEGGRLVMSRQESGTVVAGASMAGRRGHADEGGKVVVLRSQPVAHPGSHRGTQEVVAAGVNHAHGLPVGRSAGVHRLDEAKVVGVLREVRPEVTDPRPALPPLPKFPCSVENFPTAGLVLQLDVQVVEALEGKRLAVVFLQHRLGVEGIDLGDPAVHEEKDDPLGHGGVVEPGKRVRRTRGAGDLLGEGLEGKGPEAATRRLQPRAPGTGGGELVTGLHDTIQ